MSYQEDEDRFKCEKYLEHYLSENPRVQKLIDAIDPSTANPDAVPGCKIPEAFFVCRNCDANISGGFAAATGQGEDYKPEVVICQNRILHKQAFEHTLTHELVNFRLVKSMNTRCLGYVVRLQ